MSEATTVHGRHEDAEVYPGLVVNDHRVTGSIVVGRSRLPLWAFLPTAVTHGWDYVESDYALSEYGMDASDAAMFLYYLLEQRGEFARLICLLADLERSSLDRRNATHWSTVKRQRRRLADHLRRCLAEVES